MVANVYAAVPETPQAFELVLAAYFEDGPRAHLLASHDGISGIEPYRIIHRWPGDTPGKRITLEEHAYG